MAVAIANSGTQKATAGGSVTSQAVTLPGAGTADNVLLAIAFRDYGTAGQGDLTASGFTSLYNASVLDSGHGQIRVLGRIITSTENSVTVTYTGSAENLSVALFEIEGVDVSGGVAAILHDSDGYDSGATNVATIPLPAVDCLIGQLAFAAACIGDDDWVQAWSNGYTEQTNNTETSGSPDQELAVATLAIAADGTTSTTISKSSGADDRASGVIFTVKVAGAATGWGPLLSSGCNRLVQVP